MFENFPEYGIIYGVGLDGRSEVSLRSTMACTGKHPPPLFREVILKSSAPFGDSGDRFPPISEMFMSTRFRFRPSRCTKHSVMNDIEDAESSNALACVVEPSGPSILTLHVISRTCLCCVVRDMLAVTTSIDSLERGPALAALRFSLFESMCSHE